MNTPEFSEKYSQLIGLIFEQMDQAYHQAAASYEFFCNGCEDNCCETRFFHHTHIEWEYVIEGFNHLPKQKQDHVIKKAQQVCEQSKELIAQHLPVRLMCPLNEKGNCLIYTYRPMICRLHGIAHELQIPGKPIQYTPGCEAFIHHCKALKKEDYYSLDRTPHYIRMAQLEQAYKREFQIDQRFKMTIAEMLI
ncbi:MAG: hypothetical protein HQK75_13255 [Candidatus Magnetomorum sp.]|nr:hypothetical protein [Candidatus Magnetomorum sp.]